MERCERNPYNYSLAEWQQAKRVGEDPHRLKKLFQDCWAISDSKKAFAQTLKTMACISPEEIGEGLSPLIIRGKCIPYPAGSM